jgi:hypothetical protein
VSWPVKKKIQLRERGRERGRERERGIEGLRERVGRGGEREGKRERGRKGERGRERERGGALHLLKLKNSPVLGNLVDAIISESFDWRKDAVESGRSQDSNPFSSFPIFSFCSL